MFVIEKRTYDKFEGYLLDISETRQKKLKEVDKRNPKEEPIKYFEMTFQTQNENLAIWYFELLTMLIENEVINYMQ